MQKSITIPKSTLPYLLLMPVFLYYIIFWAFPVLSGFKEVFTSLDGSFSLTANFKLLMESELFYESVRNTAFFTFISVLAEYLVALLLAVLLSRKFFGSRMLMFIAMIPMAITPTATAILWKTGLMKDGWINTILLFLRFIEEPIVFMNVVDLEAVLLLIVVDAWTVTPSIMIILIAGLQGLQRDQKEAAYLFGANKWQIFRDVTLPTLKPSITTSLIIRMIAALQVWAISGMVLGYSRAPFLVERVAFYVEAIPGVSTSTKLAYTYSFVTTIVVLVATVLYLRVAAKQKEGA
jgi:multiple sugar transport system permease protein